MCVVDLCVVENLLRVSKPRLQNSKLLNFVTATCFQCSWSFELVTVRVRYVKANNVEWSYFIRKVCFWQRTEMSKEGKQKIMNGVTVEASERLFRIENIFVPLLIRKVSFRINIHIAKVINILYVVNMPDRSPPPYIDDRNKRQYTNHDCIHG